MNEYSMTPTNEPEGGDAMTTMEPEQIPTSQGGDNTEESISLQFKRLGQLLAASVKAAAATPEAAELRSELRDGAAALRRELDETVESTKDATSRMRTETVPASSRRLREEVADTLRSLNKALDKVASSVSPGGNGDDDAGSASE